MATAIVSARPGHLSRPEYVALAQGKLLQAHHILRRALSAGGEPERRALLALEAADALIGRAVLGLDEISNTAARA